MIEFINGKGKSIFKVHPNKRRYEVKVFGCIEVSSKAFPEAKINSDVLFTKIKRATVFSLLDLTHHLHFQLIFLA